MKNAVLCSLLGAFCLLIASGCSTLRGKSAVEDYNANPLTVAVPMGLSDSAVQDVMVRTLQGRGWAVIESTPNKVVGALDHRGFKTKAILVRDGSEIKILSEGTYYVIQRDENQPAVPYGWLENLQNDMNVIMSRSTY